MKITYSTPIIDLVKAGIVPEWMWRDIEAHGMEDAENILCEFDWEWGWDIGDGYTSEQLRKLEEVRNIIRQGIEVSKNK